MKLISICRPTHRVQFDCFIYIAFHVFIYWQFGCCCETMSLWNEDIYHTALTMLREKNNCFWPVVWVETEVKLKLKETTQLLVTEKCCWNFNSAFILFQHYFQAFSYWLLRLDSCTLYILKYGRYPIQSNSLHNYAKPAHVLCWETSKVDQPLTIFWQLWLTKHGFCISLPKILTYKTNISQNEKTKTSPKFRKCQWKSFNSFDIKIQWYK